MTVGKKDSNGTTAERVAKVRAAMGAAGVGALQGGEYLSVIAHAAPMLVDLAEEALRLRAKLTAITGFVHGDSPMIGPCVLGCAGTHYDVHADDCRFVGTGPCPVFERGVDGQCVLPKYHSRPHRRADGSEWPR